MRSAKLIIKNGLAHGLNTLISLGFTLAGTHLLTIEDYGELRTAMVLLPLLMMFSLPGYDNIILRNTNMNRSLHLLRIFSYRFSFALAGSFLLTIGLFFFHAQLSTPLFFFLCCIAVLLPFFETGTGYRNFLLGKRLRSESLSLMLRAKIISATLLITFISAIYILGASRLLILPAYMLALILPTLTIFMLVAWRQKKKEKIFAFDDHNRKNLHAALGATLAGITLTLVCSIDKLWLRTDLGATALASYAILVMIPQEGARLIDAMVPLFYRSLFYKKAAIKKTHIIILSLLGLVGLAAYVVGFYYLSPYVFGDEYQYNWLSVALSSLLLCGLTFEFFCSHKIFAGFGARAFFIFSLTNLITSVPIIILSLKLGGIEGLLAGLVIKQLVFPLTFMFVVKKRTLRST